MRRLILTAFSGADNASLDIGRILWFASTVALLLFEGFAIIARAAPFDPMAFSGALAALAVGHGASLKLKSETEPETK